MYSLPNKCYCNIQKQGLLGLFNRRKSEAECEYICSKLSLLRMKLGFNFFFLISCFPTGPCCLLRKLSWPPNQSLPKYHIQFGECIKIFKNGGHIIHTVYFKNFQMLFRNLLAFYNLTCPLRWFATSNPKLIVP